MWTWRHAAGEVFLSSSNVLVRFALGEQPGQDGGVVVNDGIGDQPGALKVRIEESLPRVGGDAVALERDGAELLQRRHDLFRHALEVGGAGCSQLARFIGWAGTSPSVAAMIVFLPRTWRWPYSTKRATCAVLPVGPIRA